MLKGIISKSMILLAILASSRQVVRPSYRKVTRPSALTSLLFLVYVWYHKDILFLRYTQEFLCFLAP